MSILVSYSAFPGVFTHYNGLLHLRPPRYDLIRHKVLLSTSLGRNAEMPNFCIRYAGFCFWYADFLVSGALIFYLFGADFFASRMF